jgi:hypothetical protein
MESVSAIELRSLEELADMLMGKNVVRFVGFS